MSAINRNIMSQFPNPTEVGEVVNREDAIDLLERIVEASRAAIDEVTGAAYKTLSPEEQLSLGSTSEQLAAFVTQVTTWRAG